MKIIAHFKSPDYTGRCKLKARPSIVVSITHRVCDQDCISLSLPSRLVKDQMGIAYALLSSGTSARMVESRIMKHMPSNFLSYLHLMDLNIINILSQMDEVITKFEQEQEHDKTTDVG